MPLPQHEHEDAVTREYAARRTREIAKAREKYGEAALAPAGHPKLDVLDYLINELVGLVRYAEMLEVRCAGWSASPNSTVQRAGADGLGCARQIMAAAGRSAFDVITLRQRLEKAGVKLGRGETR